MTFSPDLLEDAENLMAQGRAPEAAELLRARLAEAKGGMLARLALVRALIAAKDAAGALEAAREAASLAPDLPAAAQALGDALMSAGHLPTAIAEYQRVLRLEPFSREGSLRLAEAWLEAGEPERATDLLKKIEPGPETENVFARAAAMSSQPRSNANYVRHLFDQFSADYDLRMLQTLSYRGHLILRELAQLTMGQVSNLAVLDLGCGTGLTGVAFRVCASRLDGIDLSPRMIEAARSRGIYDRLAVADLETPPFGNDRYDLVVAADTLIYLGDLAQAFASISANLKPGGFFLFTAERESVEGNDFSLGPKRRWRHSERYLRDMATQHDFAVVGLMECSPRSEAGVPVEGWAVALQLRERGGVP